MMRETGERLRQVVDAASPRLAQIDDSESARQPSAEKWSRMRTDSRREERRSSTTELREQVDPVGTSVFCAAATGGLRLGALIVGITVVPLATLLAWGAARDAGLSRG